LDKNEISDLYKVTFDGFVDIEGKSVEVGNVVGYYNPDSSTWEPDYIITDRYFKITDDNRIIPFVEIRAISRIYSDNKLKTEIVGSKIVSCDSIMLMKYTDEYKFLLNVVTEFEKIIKDLSKKYDVDSEEYRKMRILKVTNLLLDKQWCISLDKYFNKE